MKRMHGFNLTEMLVVVSLISILGLIAYPNYVQYLLTSNRVEAINALNDLQSRMESYRALNGGYTNSSASLGVSASPYTTANGNYSITYTVVGTTAYTLKADVVPAGNQKKDTACWQFLVTDKPGTNNRTQSATTSGSVDNSAECWGSR